MLVPLPAAVVKPGSCWRIPHQPYEPLLVRELAVDPYSASSFEVCDVVWNGKLRLLHAATPAREFVSDGEATTARAVERLQGLIGTALASGTAPEAADIKRVIATEIESELRRRRELLGKRPILLVPGSMLFVEVKNISAEPKEIRCSLVGEIMTPSQCVDYFSRYPGALADTDGWLAGLRS